MLGFKTNRKSCRTRFNGHVLPSFPANRGFSLIELLVVIVVIGILAALLLPALSKTKQKAEGIDCVNNLKQLNLAWTLYADDNRGRLVPNMDGMGSIDIPTNWVAGTMVKPRDATNRAFLRNPRRTLLAGYLKESKVFKCPGDDSRLVRSVSMNCRLNPVHPGGSPSWIGGRGTNYVNFRVLHRIRNPSDILVFIGERSDSINEGYFAIDMSNTGQADGIGRSRPYYLIDYPAAYHNDAGTVSFADGHVESHRWLEPTTKPDLGEAQNAVYTSPGDRDVQWLQKHSTYKH